MSEHLRRRTRGSIGALALLGASELIEQHLPPGEEQLRLPNWMASSSTPKPRRRPNATGAVMPGEYETFADFRSGRQHPRSRGRGGLHDRAFDPEPVRRRDG